MEQEDCKHLTKLNEGFSGQVANCLLMQRCISSVSKDKFWTRLRTGRSCQWSKAGAGEVRYGVV